MASDEWVVNMPDDCMSPGIETPTRITARAHPLASASDAAKIASGRACIAVRRATGSQPPSNIPDAKSSGGVQGGGDARPVGAFKVREVLLKWVTV